MIRTLTIAGAAFALLTTAAAADPMASRYGNTVVATNAKGEQTKVHYNEDKTFSATLPNGGTVKGTWDAADGKLCLTQTEPAPAPEQPNPLCNPLVDHAVGDKWEIGEGDAKMSVEIVAGR